jgi:hypothetical protein
MKNARRTLVAAALVSALVGGTSTPSDAQDAPPETPDAPAPKAPAAEAAPAGDAPTAEEDAAARKVLEAAAERQGGRSLAPPDGRLESFRVLFGKVTVYRDVQNERGTTRQAMDSEDDGLEVLWKEGQIKTVWRLQGDRPVARALQHRRRRDGTTGEYRWLHDGSTHQALTDDPRFVKDREQLDRDRAIVAALLDVAILRRLLGDGSRWKLVDDTTYAGTALRRTPPAGSATPLRVTLWIDPATQDVVAAKLSPNEPGESTMLYELKYHDRLPQLQGPAGGEGERAAAPLQRFPFEFHVFEQRIVEQKPMPVMVAKAKTVSFNDLRDEDFAPAAPTKPR